MASTKVHELERDPTDEFDRIVYQYLRDDEARRHPGLTLNRAAAGYISETDVGFFIQYASEDGQITNIVLVLPEDVAHAVGNLLSGV